MSSVYSSGPAPLLPRSAPPKVDDESRAYGVIKKDSSAHENLSFQELKCIENERRQLLLRVSRIRCDVILCVTHLSANLLIVVHCTAAGRASFLEDSFLFQWNITKRGYQGFACMDNHANIHRYQSACQLYRLCARCSGHA